MKSILATILSGMKEVLSNRNYIFLFIVAFVATFAFFISIPVWVIAGNTIGTQLEIFKLTDYLTIMLLSTLYALFIAMQVYGIKQRKKVKDVGTTVGGGVGALFAGIAGTASCASCLAPFFAFFGIGFGGVLFVLEYRFYFVIGISILMIVAIYLTARRIRKVCDTC